MLKIIVCGYNCAHIIDRCFKSINMQSYKNYQTIVSLDKIEDRKYLVRNTHDTIENACCEQEDIIVLVDADDFICDEDAFKTIVQTYSENQNILLTYGSYINFSTNERGKFCGEYKPFDNYRTAEWKASHLKTFKYKLWEKLPKEHLKFDNGTWFKCCADRAIMIPLLEIAGNDRIKYIDTLLYCYDDTNINSVWRTMKNESVYTRKYIESRIPLERLETI